jgi:hypothetical protein
LNCLAHSIDSIEIWIERIVCDNIGEKDPVQKIEVLEVQSLAVSRQDILDG